MDAEYLKLDDDQAVVFDPNGVDTNVFFDETNFQVYTVNSGGETGVVVSGPNHSNSSFTFRIPNKGVALISIKLSSDKKVLAMQRNDSSVDFVNFVNGIPDTIEYSQKCKIKRGKKNSVLNFHWITNNKIAFVTNMGLEYYNINSEKRILKLIKSNPCETNWSVYSPFSKTLVLSTTLQANCLIPLQFKNDQFIKINKLSVDYSSNISSTNKEKLQNRDVSVVELYGQTFVAVLRHPNQSSINKNDKCKLDLYKLHNKEAHKMFVLPLQNTGKFAFNVVDDLLVAHHQLTKTSMVFDIKMPGFCKSSVVVLDSVLPPCELKVSSSNDESKNKNKRCDLYAKSWVFFQPNIIIDARVGCMWYLNTNLKNCYKLVKDKILMLDFLLHRSSSKSVIISLCHDSLQNKVSLAQISIFFSKFNQVYNDYIENEKPPFLQKNNKGNLDESSRIFLDQTEIFNEVLEPLALSPLPFQYKVSVLLEYIKSLQSFNIDVQGFVNTLLVNTLIKEEAFFYLQQLFKYGVISDSRAVASVLLNTKHKMFPSFHLALQMLKRLAVADREVVDILLERKLVLQALRFVKSVGMVDLVPAHPFLKAAVHDRDLFYSVYKFFEARNIKICNSPDFTEKQNCEEFRIHFIENFNENVVENL